MRAEVAALVVCLVMGAGYVLWVGWLGPCSALGWLPVMDLPARCLDPMVPGGRR